MKNKGVYVLWLYLPQTSRITIGKLGDFSFDPGVYAYVGSAQRNLEQRVARHSRLEKKLHWHIDYFRAKAEFMGTALFFEQPKTSECVLVRELLKSRVPFRPYLVLDRRIVNVVPTFSRYPLLTLKQGLIFFSDAIHGVNLGATEPFALFDAGNQVSILLRVEICDTFIAEFLQLAEPIHQSPDNITRFHVFILSKSTSTVLNSSITQKRGRVSFARKKYNNRYNDSCTIHRR